MKPDAHRRDISHPELLAHAGAVTLVLRGRHWPAIAHRAVEAAIEIGAVALCLGFVAYAFAGVD